LTNCPKLSKAFVKGSSFVYLVESSLPMLVALKFDVMPWEVTVFGKHFSLAVGFLCIVGRQWFYEDRHQLSGFEHDFACLV